MLCGDGSSMEIAFLQKGTLEPNCLYMCAHHPRSLHTHSTTAHPTA